MANEYEVRLRLTSDIVVTVEAHSTHAAMLQAWIETLSSVKDRPVSSKLIPLDAVLIATGKRLPK